MTHDQKEKETKVTKWPLGPMDVDSDADNDSDDPASCSPCESPHSDRCPHRLAQEHAQKASRFFDALHQGQHVDVSPSIDSPWTTGWICGKLPNEVSVQIDGVDTILKVSKDECLDFLSLRGKHVAIPTPPEPMVTLLALIQTKDEIIRSKDKTIADLMKQLQNKSPMKQ